MSNVVKNIDTFSAALNVAVDDYEVGKMPDAFAAAEAANFKLLFSFDMSYDWVESDMVSLVATYASSAAMYKYNGKVLVSTYCPPGANQDDSFWSGFKSDLANQGVDILLAPALTSYRDPSDAPGMASSFPSIDGFFNWWSW